MIKILKNWHLTTTIKIKVLCINCLLFIFKQKGCNKELQTSKIPLKREGAYKMGGLH